MEPSTIIGIAIAIAYFVIQALGRKRTPTPTGTPAGRESKAPRENSELDEALSEIRRALGWPEEEPRPQKPADRTESPAPTSAPPRPRAQTTQQKPRKTEPAQRERPTKLSRPGALKGQPTRRIPPSTPIPASTKFPSRRGTIAIDENAGFRAEEQFESLAANKLEKRRAVASRPESKHVPEVVARIRNPHNLLQEFLIKEILDPPLVLRRRRH